MAEIRVANTQNGAGARAESYVFSYKTLLAFVPVLYYVLNVLRMRGFSTKAVLAVEAVSCAVGLVLMIRNKGGRMTMLMLFSVVYMLSIAANRLIIGNMTTSGLISNVCLLGMTAIMLEYPWSRRQGWLGFYAILLIVVLGFMTRTQTRIFGSSNNYVSIIMILAAALYYLPLEGREGTIRIWDVAPAALTFMVSVWATGRGGILFSLVLLVLVLILYMRSLTGKKAQRIVLLVIALLIAGTVLLVSNVNLLNRFMNLGKFRTRGATDASRIKVWTAYFRKMGSSPLYILLGAPLEKIPIIHNLGDNCHNSFLQLHAFGGAGIFLAYMVLLVIAAVYFMSRKMWITFVVFLTVSLRAMTDKFIFGQYGMPIMVYLVMLPMIHRRLSRRQRLEKDLGLLSWLLYPDKLKKIGKKGGSPHVPH